MGNKKPAHWTFESFLAAGACRDWIESVQKFRQNHPLPEIHRPVPGRSLRYSVIHGEQIAESFSGLEELYRRIQVIAEEKSGLKLEPMRQRKVAININITPPGGEYRWHYDRNALTAILFLNAVEGGITEMYPGYRWALKGKTHSAWQERLDRLFMLRPLRAWFGRKVAVEPAPGRLLLMRGDRCLHSVTPVKGEADRINVIFSYDEVGALHPQEEGLNDYLYTAKSAAKPDPNYS
ncbi:MAG TPA: 2OG-Fe(II) oxygenase [bacterium]|nr:2OG-Fe(II) oxygenase [bacterium]